MLTDGTITLGKCVTLYRFPQIQTCHLVCDGVSPWIKQKGTSECVLFLKELSRIKCVFLIIGYTMCFYHQMVSTIITWRGIKRMV